MTTLSWELYSQGSGIAFHAAAVESSYAITLTRDGVNLICETGLDGSALLRRSLELRRSLQRLGYKGTPDGSTPALGGGPCWGPGPLIPVSALMAGAGAEPDYADSQPIVEMGLGYELPLCA